jgi:hypothetical protein
VKRGLFSSALWIFCSALLPLSAFATGFDHQFSTWTAFLKKNVTIKGAASTVNYKIIKSDSKDLTSILASFEGVSKPEFDQFSADQKLAFLINSYNAFTVKLIVDNYPIKSIKDAGSVFTNPWKKKFFHLFGEEQNLDGIEHEMIRKWFNEPRIHFAVVCASIGCPALKNEAYVATKLNQQFEDSANLFLSDQSKNHLNIKVQKLELSSIFKWYGGDFEKKFGSVEEFVAAKLTADKSLQDQIRGKKFPITFLDYDWSLNETK